eukprot:c9133_g1_i1.p1 GENE.c9133_g1_i1~~c9133_g1_i1.p1  ORF type:complete len:446 (-),score=125.48 c9133_g1_i1:23-1174(-)
MSGLRYPFLLLFALVLKLYIDCPGIIWSPNNGLELREKIVVITGASSGIGLAASKIFVREGARVVLGCRSPARCAIAIQEIENFVGGYNEQTRSIEPIPLILDLDSLESVQAFASELHKRFDHIDVLVNNGGLVSPPKQRTVEGFEKGYGVMHLGHFLLTNQVLDLLQSTTGGPEPSRVVHHSSAAFLGLSHIRSLTTAFDLRGEVTDGCPFTLSEMKNHTDGWYAFVPCPVGGGYVRAKMAQAMFSLELQKRFGHPTTPNVRAISSYALHPGSVHTAILSSVMNTFPMPYLLRPPMVAAENILRCATDRKIKPGSFLDGMGFPHNLTGSGTDAWFPENDGRFSFYRFFLELKALFWGIRVGDATAPAWLVSEQAIRPHLKTK